MNNEPLWDISFPLGPTDSGDTESQSSSSGPSSLSTTPCVDLLLSENVLSHTLAASRMPVAPGKLNVEGGS